MRQIHNQFKFQSIIYKENHSPPHLHFSFSMSQKEFYNEYGFNSSNSLRKGKGIRGKN